MGKRTKNPFAGKVKCPHPNCDHIGELITKVHCRMHHGMEREELFAQYGQPQSLTIDPIRRRENMKITTIIPNNQPVILGQKKGTMRA